MKCKESAHGVVALRDIANHLNLSISTISRALNGDPGVSKVHAASIRAVADEMGYRPQPIRCRRTRAIGLVISTAHDSGPDPNERYFQQLCWSMERLVMQRRLHLHLQFVRRDESNPEIPPVVRENRVDGIVLAGHPSPALCERVRETNVPVVAVSDTVERTGLDCVMSDETQALQELVGRMVSMGHSHVTWVSTDRRFPVVAAGESAFRAASRQAGLKELPHSVIDGFSPDLAGGRRATEALIGCDPMPTAMIFANDWMAFGGMVQLQRRGLRVPGRISIVGQGNDGICEECDPRLTTIDRRVGDVLAESIELLCDRIGSGQAGPRQQRVPARLLWRDSVSPALAAGHSGQQGETNRVGNAVG